MLTVVYIIVGIVGLFLALQYIMVFSAKRLKGFKINGLKGNLKKLERKGSKGLVYFYSPSCRACKAQTPIIKQMQRKNNNVFDVDISRDMNTAQVFGIKATPTTIVVESGTVIEVFLGVKTSEVLLKALRG